VFLPALYVAWFRIPEDPSQASNGRDDLEMRNQHLRGGGSAA